MKIYQEIFALGIALFLMTPEYVSGGNYSRVDEDRSAPLSGKMPLAQSPKQATGARLTEKLHRQYMENETYALADGLLNVTWGLMKANLPSGEYNEALQSQREWVKSGRDAQAAALLSKMGAAEAYAQIMRERADYLASLIAADPKEGRYVNNDGEFLVKVVDGIVAVEGHSEYKFHSCDYDGEGGYMDGWITLSHPDYSDFYLLFTHNGATIFYNSSELGQGCGIGAGFEGNYKFGKR